MKNRLLFLSIILILMNKGMAQTQAKTNFLNKNRFGVGVNISTNGVGAQLAYSILKKSKLIARVESRYFYSDIKDKEITIYRSQMLVNGYIKRGSIGFMLDYHPFGNSFKLSSGFAILFNEINNVVSYKDSVPNGNINISPDEIGTITIGYNLKSSPYFGIGFGKSVPKKRVGFCFEIGFYYTGIPTIKTRATKMLEPISTMQYPVLVNDWYYGNSSDLLFDELSFLPVINCGLNIKLGKIEN